MSAEITQQVQELLSRPSKSDVEQFRPVFSLEHAPNGIVSALSLTPANLLYAMHRARKERDKAESHRGFNVGATVMGFQLQPTAFQFTDGHNIKREPGEAAVNIHAEQFALERARQLEIEAVSMVVVVSETQPDQQSGHEMCTLHPCGLCRDAMSDNPLINDSTTLIASALPSFRTIELYDLRSLRDFHDNDPNAQITRFDLPPLKIFEPVVDSGAPIRLADDEETFAEEKIWNDSIGTYLARRRFDLLSSLES